MVHPQHHPILREVHQAFCDAGSQAITTNSYGIVPGVMAEESILAHVDTAGRIAKQCDALILGSVGPLVESYRPDRIMPHNEGRGWYRDMIGRLLPHVDAIMAETMSCYEESAQAVAGVRDNHNSDRIPLLISYTLDGAGRLRNGETVRTTIRKLLDYTQKEDVDCTYVSLRETLLLSNCSQH